MWEFYYKKRKSGSNVFVLRRSIGVGLIFDAGSNSKMTLGHFLNSVGLFARWSIETKNIALLLPHQSGTKRRHVRELLHAHIGLFAADDSVFVEIRVPVFFD